MDKKVVIVDDEAHIRILLEETLEELSRRGVKIFTAKNGREGLELIKKERPNLVFLDAMMPEMNGYEVCKKVKSDFELKNNTYVIMLTAKGQLQDKTRGILSGTDEYITKPFDPDMILEKAKSVLGIVAG